MTGRPSEELIDCVVIGAGPAGLSAARALTSRGRSVVVLDKGRGPGGRLSSRRTGETRFDHGCKELTFQEPETSADLQEWLEADVVAPWCPTLEGGSTAGPYHVGTPAMNQVIKHLASPIAPNASNRSASWTISASIVSHGMPAAKLWASMQ